MTVPEEVVWSPMTKGEADIVAASLRSIGIDARVKGEIIRAYGPIGQMQVMVNESDAEEARTFLEENPYELAADELDGVVGISPQRSRRAGLVLIMVCLAVPAVVLVAVVLDILIHL
jgi:hypothetical protein